MFWRTKINWAQIGPNSPAAIKFGTHAVQGYSELVLVPNDPLSVAFAEKTSKICTEVVKDGVTERELNWAANELSVAVEEFTEKQRQAIEASIAEVYWGLNSLLLSLEGTVKCASTLQADTEKSVQQLSKLDKVESFEALKSGIKAEIASLKSVITENRKNMLAVRKIAGDQLEDLREKLSVAEKASRTDQLTQLGNRTAFDLLAEDAIRQSAKEEIWLAIIDLDKFKQINDTQGHLAGDAALSEVSDRLKEVFCQSGCYVTRLGGDEFAVIFRGSKAQFESRLYRTADSFVKRPLTFGGQEVPVGLSYGSARFLPERSLSDTLMLADTQMYTSKRANNAA